ncbi:MAG: type II secretion system F family protein [Tabrizicola sp.]|uniref:type II secretion system F family protein n=1 Tax=Tabrizicola sp. TaxID=2005166 RepID=UPI0027346664|nr:type II secretion system F family protein [Tabrizicola sp.]MDP3263011.1 type II secretion system F family protein [Tabrizicola sp.]MDP3648546.1 type II secretion system F family protein [Paracoccaceae bacterium]MDZ4067418.1 type II secretion system F family protein [Tabrizicola sp.]
MEISAAPLIYLLIFVAVVVLVEGLYLTVFGKSISLNSRMSRRLSLLEKNSNREQVLEQLRKEMNQHLNAKNIPLYSILAKKAQKANIAFSPKALIGIMALLSVFSFLALTVATSADAMIRAVLAVGMGVGGVYVWVNNKAKKRIGLLEEQLPDSIELMVRSLRVGHPFSAAIGIVAKEIPDPLGSEFGIIADEAAYGRDVTESLKAFAERMDSQDLRFLAVAVAIQQQSGGNLAEILEGLSKVIRARFKLFRKVKAITAEAKWSGMFLSAFPILALIMINVIQPDYYDEVRETSVFIPTALVVVVFLVVNIIFMKIMTNIKV